MITGIEHTAIFAKDTKKLAKWYADILDAEIVYDNGGVYFISFQDKSMIEFCPSSDLMLEYPEFDKMGVRHIALAVDDFYAASAKIRASRAEIIKDTAIAPGGVKTMFFRDPEGNILHLISRTKPLV